MKIDKRIKTGSVVRLEDEIFEGVVVKMLSVGGRGELCVCSKTADGEHSSTYWYSNTLDWKFIRMLTIEECLTHESELVRALGNRKLVKLC